MKIIGVSITCIIITFSCLLMLSEVHQELNGVEEQKELTHFWKRQTAIQEIRLAIQEAKFADFKQDVAVYLPEAILQNPDEDSQRVLRNVASVVPHPKLKLPLGLRAKELMEKGKALVVENKYKEGIASLESMLEHFPDSPHRVEAHYLIVESYFNLKKFENVVESVDAMVEVFPENRLTGYALLKLGGLYERQDRLEDALQIYRTILSAFQDDPNLMTLAQKNVKLLEL